MTCGTEPFRFWIIDGAVKPTDADAIPGPQWSGWEAVYANDCEAGKRTARKELPGAIAGTLAALRSAESVAAWSGLLGYPVEDDPTLHGGGLHVTEPGGYLGVHLDYDRHPLLPEKRRALNLITFAHPEWREPWGGRLLLCDPMGEPVVKIDPLPGRLVAFEVSDLSYHGVEPVTGPAERVSVAAYFLVGTEVPRECDRRFTRRKAMFLPRR